MLFDSSTQGFKILIWFTSNHMKRVPGKKRRQRNKNVKLRASINLLYHAVVHVAKNLLGRCEMKQPTSTLSYALISK